MPTVKSADRKASSISFSIHSYTSTEPFLLMPVPLWQVFSGTIDPQNTVPHCVLPPEPLGMEKEPKGKDPVKGRSTTLFAKGLEFAERAGAIIQIKVDFQGRQDGIGSSDEEMLTIDEMVCVLAK